MATRKQKTKVGVFVVVCILLIAGGLLLISGYKQEERIPYWIEFDESVLGLGMGGMVEYLGVPVGTVNDIFVTPFNKAHVELLIAKNKVTLKQGVTGQLVLYSLATGTMCISLDGGKGEDLPPGSEIKSRKSLVKAVSTQVEGILEKLNNVTDTIKKGLDGMEEGDLAKVVQHADSFIQSGEEFLDKTNETMADVKKEAKSVLQDFQGLTKDVKKLVRDTDEAVQQATSKIKTLDLATTGENVNETLKNVSALSKRLQDSANAVDTISRRALHEADNVEYNLRETLRTLNESLEAVRELTVYLQQDPSALLRGKGKGTGKP